MTKLRSNLYTRSDSKSSVTEYRVEFYTQPMIQHMIFRLYHKYDMSKVVLKVTGWLETPYEKWNHRGGKCHNEVMWTRTATGTKFPGCGCLPLAAQQDIRCFELSQKKNKHIGSVRVSKQLWLRLKGARMKER